MEHLAVRKSFFVGTCTGDISSAYEFGKSIGKGMSGEVVLATHKSSGQVRAIKKLVKTKITTQERLQTEIDVMKTSDHPYIVKLYEVWEDSRYIYLVQECCKGGELYNYIDKRRGLTEREAARIFHQILTAVSYLHQNNIVHRDLKLENLLFANEDCDLGLLKLCDFGLSKNFVANKKMMSTLGTPTYIAPEVLGDTGYGTSCDMWSCGVILYMLLSGIPPFFGSTPASLLARIRNGPYDFHRKEWTNVSESAKDLVRNLLVVDTEARFNVEQALSHPWIADNDTVPDVPLAINLESFQQFTNGTRLRKLALLCIASQCSDADIHSLRESFIKLDTNKDGTLSIAELQQGIATVPGLDLQIEDMMREMDIDRSGRIDYSEFLASSIEEHIYLQEEKLCSAFKIFDRDNSGKISAVELREILGKEALGNDEAFWANLIEESDVNHDGEIDFNEFLGLMSNKKLAAI